MTSQPQEIALRLIDGDTPTEAGNDRNDLRSQVETAEMRSAEVERELDVVIDQEAEATRRLETRRSRRGALEQELHAALKELARLTQEEALASGNTMLIEAEEAVAARLGEAARITQQAQQEAEQIIAEAKAESAALVDQGRERLLALEEDAITRATELDNRHRVLTERVQVMEALFNELQATLKVVAESSIEDLGASQDSLRQLDESHPPPEAPLAVGPELESPSDTGVGFEVL